MNPDPTPPLPPVFPPIGTKLKFTTRNFWETSEERGAIVEVVYLDKVRFRTTCTDREGTWEFDPTGDEWKDGLEIVEPIALANGIGVVPEIRTKQMGEVAIATDGERSAIGTTEENARLLIHAMRGTSPEQAAKPEAENPISDQAKFSLRWKDGAYSVSIPNYGGGEVVPYKTAKTLEVRLGIALSELAAANSESEKWRFKFLTQRDETNRNTWVWIGDGEDHPESLACPVIMAPDQLREFVAAKDELTQANAAVGRLTSILESIRDHEDAPSVDLCGEERVGVHCGVEDRRCSDRYEGADYGYSQGVFRGLEWASNLAGFALEGTPPAPDGWREIGEAAEEEVFIVTDWEHVAFAEKCERDGGGFYWAEGDDSGLDWEPTHFQRKMPLPKPPSGKGEA